MKCNVIALLCALFLLSEDVVKAQDKLNVSIFLIENRQTIEARFDALEELPQNLVKVIEDIQNYQLLEIESPDEPEMVVLDRTTWIDTSKKPEWDQGGQTLTIHLKQGIPYKKTLMLVINKFEMGNQRRLVSRFNVKPEAEILAASNVTKQTKVIRISSKIPIQAQTKLQVDRSVITVEKDFSIKDKSPEKIDAIARKLDDYTVEVHLAKKLGEGQEHGLAITSGLSDGSQSFTASGSVKTPGAATKPVDPKISLSLSNVAAVNQYPVFDLTAKITPLGIIQVGDSVWTFVPNLSADVGLRSTKSANSVVFDLPFRTSILGFDAGPAPKGVKRPTHAVIYAAWKKTPWYRLSDVGASVGPKFEADRKFERVNTLGALRLDFNFHKWKQTIALKRKMIVDDLGEKRGGQFRGFTSGFEFVPYLAFNFGAHANNETVFNEKKKVSVSVPQHAIFRSQFGLQSTVEWRLFNTPVSLSIDESILHLAQRETIGLVTTDGVALRQLRGFHHFGKATLDLSLDSNKHYSFTVVFQNGRVPPNFEYLNRVSTGIKVTY